MQQTWFITGSSRGFGRALTQAALDTGDRVVATARSPQTLDDLAADHSDDLLAVALDVTDPDAVRSALRAGIERFGRLDVVVNNAGYANVAPIETGDDEDFRNQFETAIIVQIAKRENIPSHILLGVNAADMALAYSRHQLDQAATWEQVSRSADFGQPYPAAFPTD